MKKFAFLLVAIFVIFIEGKSVFSDTFSIGRLKRDTLNNTADTQQKDVREKPEDQQLIILEELPDGRFRAADNAIISGGNLVEDSEEAKILFTIDNYRNLRIILPDEREDVLIEQLPDGDFRSKSGKTIAPDGLIRGEGGYAIPAAPEPVETTAEKPEQNTAEAGAGQPPLDMEALLSGENLMAQMSGSGKKEAVPNAPKTPAKGNAPAKPEKQQPKKGDKFNIPPEAAAKKDLSFTKGCWRSNSLTYYDGFSPYRAPAELCFDSKGNGTFTSYVDGDVCRARAWARFGKNGLGIKALEGPCASRTRYAATMPRNFICEGTGQSTECYILAKDKRDVRRKFKSRALFYKK